MPKWLTSDNISALWLIIEKAREFFNDHHLFIAFIDFKAVFDSVDHLALWSILRNMGVAGKLVNLLSSIYDGAEYYVRVNG